jgi:hypothetical protein
MHPTAVLWVDSGMACFAQMGGAEGVSAAELTSITLSCAKGMKVCAIPRVPA